mmetsp:Transcript_58536/g.188079  ORF Transcript_58536/g.188079 Transcript_58536/m.188079 type:complete len:299 (+) Transcript_58536:63-959(+)
MLDAQNHGPSELGEGRLLLREEGLSTDFEVLRLQHGTVEGPHVAHALCGAVALGVLAHLLRGPDGHGRLACDGLRQREGRRPRRGLVLRDARDEAEAQRLLRVELPAREGELPDPAHVAGDERHAVQRAQVGRQAHVHLLDGEARVGRAVAHVARGGEVHAGPDACAVHARDGSLRHLRQDLTRLLETLDDLPQEERAARRVGALGLQLVRDGRQVYPGTEVLALPAQHDNVGVVVARQGLEGLDEPVKQFGRAGVQLAGAVQRHLGDVREGPAHAHRARHACCRRRRPPKLSSPARA